ncbi:hypothetical protein JR316_0009553 [Psilocybe cubensis]|uniref:NadR/Ttd14 AAA domain-containing protein n=2 Tax=Psilocybe cubensis TaxID=181762 RepID=A0A8H8CE25_PSICU|nr:hypothetical protein JR316_0009553 [Psilocybe cubensis]KAH9477347.1 hypothetical protein JR316_0009553 [Psilocybe cubensis]
MPEKTLSIYVVGPSSTGKTTLCNALAQRLGLQKPAYVTEIARKVMRDKGYSRDTIGSLQMQQDIMEAYFEQEKMLDELGCCVRLFDRSALDPVVYAILTSTDADDRRARKEFLLNSDKFRKVLARYRSDTSLVILLKPVSEWIHDDGVRSLENQQECGEIFEALLHELNIKYRVFGKGVKYLEERVTVVMGLAKL